MFSWTHKTRRQSSKKQRLFAAEVLEARSLLSSSEVMTPDIVYAAASNGTVQGFTPAEIKKAYGFDSIASADNGAGQTIAIIDAYNDPNIAGDLAVFDEQFDLAAPSSLKIVNETGGSTLPATDGGWAGEISLDVEWAHAIAPGANLLLVEASAATTEDLMAAVNYARHASGVSVVSMSWGGSEFFSWNGGGESSSQTSYDPIFTTPAGHQGVTFVASAGDSGTQSGVQWPASSPNVLSVGGTTLTVDSNGNYVSEQSWNGTNGGYSQIEVQPSYQNNVQSTGARSVPDVAYDADPNTGFAVYDSLSYDGYVGWQEVGGTSAGAPQWAALIALADQARVSAGETTLDGVSQTLPMLYALYSSPDSTDYTNYTTYFNDVIDQVYSRDPWHWGWGGYGNDGNQAVAGYDAITGLGTPHANAIITALTGGSSSTSTGSPGSTGTPTTGGTPTTPAALPDSPISGAIDSQLPTTAVEDAAGWLRLDLTNTGSSRYTGTVTISLYALAGTTIGSSDSPFATVTLKKVNLGAGKHREYRVNFTWPSGITAGNYNIIASLSTSTTTNPTEAIATTTVNISPATVDLATAFKNTNPITVNPGHDGTATITITNDGNVTANGSILLSLFAATGNLLDATATMISSVLTRKIHLRPNHAITLHVRFAAPLNRTAGTYNIIASTTSTTTPSDQDTANDTAVIGTVG